MCSTPELGVVNLAPHVYFMKADCQRVIHQWDRGPLLRQTGDVNEGWGKPFAVVGDDDSSPKLPSFFRVA